MRVRILALCLLAACSRTSAPEAPPVVDVSPSFATDKVNGDPDDPSVWVNAAVPARSLIIGTVKEPAPAGALAVFDLNGKTIQTAGNLDRPNNVDIEYGLNLALKDWPAPQSRGGESSTASKAPRPVPASQPVDIAVTTERYKRQLRVFRIAPDGSGIADVSSGGGIPVFEGQAGESGAPMGIALYKRPKDGAIFAIVGRKTGPREGYLWQYRLEDDGAGKVRGVKVREFGAFSGSEEIEAVAVDDALGFVYYADEGAGIRKYHADPDHPGSRRELALFGQTGFVANREGIGIYMRAGGTGYIVCTDQIAGNSRYRLYRREGKPGAPHDHSEVVKVIAGKADSTDGIEVISAPLGPRFPHGLLVAMNSAGQNFLVFDWAQVAGTGEPKLGIRR
jgi:3-phytase